MRAFWAAVSRVNGGKGGRDMVTSGFDGWPYVAAQLRLSMASSLSPDS